MTDHPQDFHISGNIGKEHYIANLTVLPSPRPLNMLHTLVTLKEVQPYPEAVLIETKKIGRKVGKKVELIQTRPK